VAVTIKSIILLAAVLYLVLGLFWYGRETTAQDSVDDTCGSSKLAWWLATIFLILSWPYWLWKRISLYILAYKAMSGKR
jgi:hypothetical protein